MGLFAFPECDSNSCAHVRVRGERTRCMSANFSRARVCACLRCVLLLFFYSRQSRGGEGGASVGKKENVAGAFGPCTHDCVCMCIWRGACANLARLGNLNSLDAPRHHAFYASVYGHAHSTHPLKFAFGSRPCINQFLTEEVLKVRDVS